MLHNKFVEKALLHISRFKGSYAQITILFNTEGSPGVTLGSCACGFCSPSGPEFSLAISAQSCVHDLSSWIQKAFSVQLIVGMDNGYDLCSRVENIILHYNSI